MCQEHHACACIGASCRVRARSHWTHREWWWTLMCVPPQSQNVRAESRVWVVKRTVTPWEYGRWDSDDSRASRLKTDA